MTDSPPRLTAWEPDQWSVAQDWRAVVDAYFASAAGQQVAAFVQSRIAAGATIYPPEPLRALALTPLATVRVVILGQDPYHGPGQAEGLAFSVRPGVAPPPSLRNILRELGVLPVTGSLANWARQGVLLLNTVFTVEAARPASHAGQGWEVLADALLEAVAARAQPCVYLLWGKPAQSKAALVERMVGVYGGQALVLRANHPSPLAARRPPVPFIGCGHFDRARCWLGERGYPDPLFSFESG